MTEPFIDHMLSHLEMCFSNLQQKAMITLQIILSVIYMQTGESYVADLVDFFKYDLPSPSTLQQELHLWRFKLQNYVGDVPDSQNKVLCPCG